MKKLRTLSPADELKYLKEIHGTEDRARLFSSLIANFDVLQGRAQLLLSLIALCLTVSGFSGPGIAQSGDLARNLLVGGLAMVLVAALLLVLGPLQLRWGTRQRAELLDDSLIALIERRNGRTIKYHAASAFLVVGLSCYVGSVIAYMLSL